MLKFLKVLLYFLSATTLLVAIFVYYINWQIKNRGFEDIDRIRLNGKLYIMSSDSLIEIDLENRKYEVKYGDLPILIQWLGVVDDNTFLYSEDPSEKNIIRLDIRTGQKQKVGSGFPFSYFDKNLAAFNDIGDEIELYLKDIETKKETVITKLMKSSIPSFQWEQQFLAPIKYSTNSIIFLGNDLKIWVYSLDKNQVIKKFNSNGLAPIFLREDKQKLLCRDVLSEKYVWLDLVDGKVFDSIIPAEADFPIYAPELNGVFYSGRGFLERRDLFYLDFQNKKNYKIYKNTGYSNGFWFK